MSGFLLFVFIKLLTLYLNFSIICPIKQNILLGEIFMLDFNQFVTSANQPAEVIFSNLLWRGGIYQTNADWLEIDITKHPAHLELKLNLLINTDDDLNTDDDPIGTIVIPFITLAEEYGKTVKEIKDTVIVYDNEDAVKEQDEDEYIKFALFQDDPVEWYEEFDGKNCLKIENVIQDLLNNCYGK